MSATPQSRFEDLKSLGQLPSPGGVALEIMRLTQQEDVTLQQLSRVVQVDPALSGRLIQLANASLGGQRRAVGSVAEAIRFIGFAAVRQAALGFSLLSANREGACIGFDYDGYWGRCLAMGIAGQALAPHFKVAAPEECFALGLLANIGTLALASVYPQAYSRMLATAGGTMAPDLLEMERAEFALDHAQVSAAMLADWGFPPPFISAVQHYGNPALESPPAGSRIAALADCLSLCSKIAAFCTLDDERRPLVASALVHHAASAAIDEAAIAALLPDIVQSWQQWGRLLSLPTRDVPTLAALAASTAAPVLRSRSSAPLRILIADEDSARLRSTLEQLGRSGHAVTGAGSFEDAMRQVISDTPQVVVLELDAAGAALRFCRSLRTSDTGRRIYVVAVGDAGREALLEEALAAGADSVLGRPYLPERLQARLQSAQRLVELQASAQRDSQARGRIANELAITNRRLQDSEDFARATIDSVRANICVLDAQGTVLAVNRSWREFRDAHGPGGVEANYLVGANYLAVCDAAARQGITDSGLMATGIRAVMRGERETFAMEYPCITRDQRFWFLARVTRFQGKSGKIVIAHEDITDRKNAEMRVRQSEQRFRDFSRSSADWFWETDAQLRFCWLSENFAENFGLDADEVLGKTRTQLLEVDRLNPPELLQEHNAGLERREAFRNFEYFIRTRTGIVACQSVSGVPYNDAAGNFGGYRGVGQDVSENKRLQRGREEALKRLQKIASRLPGVVYQFRRRPDGKANFPFASEYLRTLFGVDPQDVRDDASPVIAALHPEDRDGVVNSIRQSAQDLTTWHREFRVRFADGTVKWLFGDAVPEREDDGSVLWHGYIWDITERKKVDQVIRDMAFYDTLTLLPNRRLLADRLTQAMGASKRSGLYGALLVLDLDDFKPLNDAHGHGAGDQLLREAARRLKLAAREIDTVSRYGGDEFVVVLKQLHADAAESLKLARAIAERLRADMESPYRLTVTDDHGQETTIEHRCTMSIGGALFRGDEISETELFKRADVQMYRAKDASGNAVLFYAEGS